MLAAIKYVHSWADAPLDTGGDVLLNATMKFIERHWNFEQEKKGESAPLAVEREEQTVNGSGGPH